jgi:ferritin-like protein
MAVPQETGLSKAVLDSHRAIESLREELEAVDWYDQRAGATQDEALKALLIHNRDEEKEHAAMLLEWLRRRDPKINENLETYLNSKGPIHEVEAATKDAANDAGPAPATDPAEAPPATGDGSLGIGSLRQMGR